jgi:endo-1,4-beta-D-glucanase Y
MNNMSSQVIGTASPSAIAADNATTMPSNAGDPGLGAAGSSPPGSGAANGSAVGDDGTAAGSPALGGGAMPGSGGAGPLLGSGASVPLPVAGAGGGGAPANTNDSGAAYPFPRNIASPYCVSPTDYDAGDVLAAYQLWKDTVVTSEGASGFLRVRKPDSGSVIDSTVSEGMGYGLLLTVYMDDQQTFDALWRYVLLYLNGNGLMDWEIDPQGEVIGVGAALDGDEDMAWALVMADRQWGGAGTLDDTYLNYAIELIHAMWDHEIDHTRGEMPLPGDSWAGADVTNISYFAPAYYRVFGELTDNVDGWNAAVDRSYEIVSLSLSEAQGNAENGLVPAWCDSRGVPVEAFGGAPTHFQNDSTRTPFRIGQDYCYFGEPRALEYMKKITSFYTAVGVENIVDGYELDGTPRPDFSMNGLQPASFIGPAGVGALYSAENQEFINAAYAALATGELTAGTIYYQKSWSALSLLMMTGNFTVLPAP